MRQEGNGKSRIPMGGNSVLRHRMTNLADFLGIFLLSADFQVSSFNCSSSLPFISPPPFLTLFDSLLDLLVALVLIPSILGALSPALCCLSESTRRDYPVRWICILDSWTVSAGFSFLFGF